MERQEFSQLISEMRESLHFSKYRVAKDSGLTCDQVHYIDNAKYSYLIDNMFRYLNVMNVAIKVYSESHKSCFLLKQRSDFSKAFIKMRKDAGLSQRKLAEVLGLVHGSISGIESGNRNTSIDIFLKCIYALGYEVELIKA